MFGFDLGWTKYTRYGSKCDNHSGVIWSKMRVLNQMQTQIIAPGLSLVLFNAVYNNL